MNDARQLPIGPSGLIRKIETIIGGSKEKKAWIQDGFIVLRDVFLRSQIDRYNTTVAKVRREVDDGKDEYGYGDRIGQLHQKEPELLELAASPRVLNFLKWAFNEDPVLFGSLQFEKGSQQEAHVDAIFFWPEPCYSLAGVWVALEDVHEDAGPLFFLPGSHKWPFPRSENVVSNRPELAARRAAARNGMLSHGERAALADEIANAWTADFKKIESEQPKKRIPICLKAGDVVIWHSLLAHGGSPRNDPTRSRRSTVFHYFGKTSKLFTLEHFMFYNKAELPLQQPISPAVEKHKGVRFIRFPQFVTYSGGKQILHPV